ncbi:hypothetical protein [Arthrobacter sp. efr-133-TYG-118]|uniref:hypothetical protein n=1 Tax=Arthrobacter sp. efr-133-TYG-118 TaxID=3040279 RepID=UPI00254A5B94|nr:hypothetical protein [Arthrobacter sp. efr-133-TYG-118]
MAESEQQHDDGELLTCMTALPPFEETEQGRRELEAKPGFTGTLQEYLDWLDKMLMYGGRVEQGLLGLMYWESSHRGGLFIFQIPQDALDSEQVLEWMKPETNVFETIYLVDEIRIPHESWIIDPEREKVELSCGMRTDENGNIRRTLIVMPEELDDETLRLFHRRTLEQGKG